MKRLLIFLTWLPLAGLAQKNYPQLMDKYMTAELKVKDYNGAVLVVKKGKTIYQKAFGEADREWKIANTSQTKFRIGSVTKQFTAACILQLAEAGKLQLDDKLSKYFPDYPKGDSVTIHMLLNHTSGIHNYTDMPAFWSKAALPLSTDSMIAFFKKAPYDFSPGTKWRYSNSGYFLLGVIVQKASKQSFRNYLLQHIIQKIGLPDTDMDRPDSILQYRAKGYSKSKWGWRQAEFISMNGPFSAGAMFSTTTDLYKWMKALVNHEVISAVSLQKMTTPYMSSYGYGVIIDSLDDHSRIWHNGGIPGFTSHLAYYPADDVYVVALSNNDGNTDRVGISLASILFDKKVTPPYTPKEIALKPAILERYTGKYMVNTAIELIIKDGKLYRHRFDAPDIELKPESATRFFYADLSDRFIEFEVDAAGNVTRAWFLAAGEKIEMKKL